MRSRRKRVFAPGPPRGTGLGLFLPRLTPRQFRNKVFAHTRT
jgi:hypothetical protein